MWRLANKVYRAFRNTATHRCQQDILLPYPTACSADDDENPNRKKNDHRQTPVQFNINDVIKQNQFSSPDLEKIQNCLTNFAIEQFIDHYTQDQQSKLTDDTLVIRDEACLKTIEKLSAIQDESLSEIHLQMAVDALDAGDFVRGVRLLELSVASSRNAAAFYNLGLCYEEGLGVEQNRDKACEFYRQASLLGHVNAQLNLTRLSNHIDLFTDDDDDDDNDVDDEQSLGTVKDLSCTPPSTVQQHRFAGWIDSFDEDLSISSFSSNWAKSPVVCLSS